MRERNTREAMPLIRYVITDRVKLQTEHNCPCGRKSPIVHHYGRDAGQFPFGDRMISMADLEERLFRLPSDVIGNIWMIVVTPEAVHFRVEAAQPDAAAHRKAEAEVSALTLVSKRRLEDVELGLRRDIEPPHLASGTQAGEKLFANLRPRAGCDLPASMRRETLGTLVLRDSAEPQQTSPAARNVARRHSRFGRKLREQAEERNETTVLVEADGAKRKAGNG